MMKAIKTTYDDLPETIIIPKEFVHKKAEIIIIVEDSAKKYTKNKLVDFFGTIPDFPDRQLQGDFEERDSL
jgi:hypothetical protein